MDLLLFCWCTVKGGAADTEVLGDGDFGFTGSGPPTGLLHSLWGQGAFTPLVLAGCIRQGDALGLALPDDGPFGAVANSGVRGPSTRLCNSTDLGRIYLGSDMRMCVYNAIRIAVVKRRTELKITLYSRTDIHIYVYAHPEI